MYDVKKYYFLVHIITKTGFGTLTSFNRLNWLKQYRIDHEFVNKIYVLHIHNTCCMLHRFSLKLKFHCIYNSEHLIH